LTGFGDDEHRRGRQLSHPEGLLQSQLTPATATHKKTRNSLGLRILRPSYSECASSPTERIEKPVAGNGFISENFTQGCD